MVKHVIGNLFDGDVDIIAHQVNCRSVMGSGVARQVRSLFPNVYEAYRSLLAECRNKSQQLGHNQYIRTEHNGRNIVIVNMFAQLDYGYDGKLYTDYEAFRSCMQQLRRFVHLNQGLMQCRIGLPYKIACDRGGGNWEIVYRIICDELRDCDVTLFELPNNARS